MLACNLHIPIIHFGTPEQTPFWDCDDDEVKFCSEKYFLTIRSSSLTHYAEGFYIKIISQLIHFGTPEQTPFSDYDDDEVKWCSVKYFLNRILKNYLLLKANSLCWRILHQHHFPINHFDTLDQTPFQIMMMMKYFFLSSVSKYDLNMICCCSDPTHLAKELDFKGIWWFCEIFYTNL